MSANSKPRSFVPQTQIKNWEREFARLGKQSAKIEKRRAQIKTLIDTARSLGISDEVAAVPVRVSKRRTNKPRKSAHVSSRTNAERSEDTSDKPERGRRSVWKPIVLKIAKEARGPVSYSDAREMILKTDLGEKLKQSDKGFYHAITKLNKAGDIKAYRGFIFSIEAHKQYEADLAAGRIKPLKFSNPAHVSPMGNAISDLMKTRPRGVLSGNVRWELQKNPEFAEAIERNPTHLYNVLARMVRQGDLVKRGKRYYSPETGTPSDDAEGASNLFEEGGSSSGKGQGAA